MQNQVNLTSTSACVKYSHNAQQSILYFLHIYTKVSTWHIYYHFPIFGEVTNIREEEIVNVTQFTFHLSVNQALT